jgi:hypothetical protein
MAGNDNQDSQQSNTNATGPNPYMTFSGGPTFSGYRAGGYGAFASYPVQHHVVHHVKKWPLEAGAVATWPFAKPRPPERPLTQTARKCFRRRDVDAAVNMKFPRGSEMEPTGTV